MAVVVPTDVEHQLRQKWSRRAKLKGYALIGAYIAAMVALFVVFDGRGFWWFFWGSGFAVGARYLRVGRALEGSQDLEAGIHDEATLKLEARFEERIDVEGKRHIAGGSLSVAAPTTDGELSLASDEGALSVPDEA